MSHRLETAAVLAHSSHHASYLRGLAQVPRCREDPGSLLKMTPTVVDAVGYQSLRSPSTPQNYPVLQLLLISGFGGKVGPSLGLGGGG